MVYVCRRCDVYGAGPTCWHCGSGDAMVAESPETSYGSHVYAHALADVMCARQTVRIDEPLDQLL